MEETRYRLSARVSSARPEAIEATLRDFLARTASGATASSVTEIEGEFRVDAELRGGAARDLNRALLSELRRVEKRTRLRAQWTAPDGTTESYFDYVLKKTSTG